MMILKVKSHLGGHKEDFNPLSSITPQKEYGVTVERQKW